jgi:hypothetical protein
VKCQTLNVTFLLNDAMMILWKNKFSSFRSELVLQDKVDDNKQNQPFLVVILSILVTKKLPFQRSNNQFAKSAGKKLSVEKVFKVKFQFRIN